MKKSSLKSSAQKVSFQSKLENIAEGMEYYAVSVPEAVTKKLKTKKAVPVQARVNGSEVFVASFYPIGEGRHYLRIRNEVCKSVKIKKGDRVRIVATVRNHADEVEIPKDVVGVLRAERALKDFEDLPLGQRSFFLESEGGLATSCGSLSVDRPDQGSRSFSRSSRVSFFMKSVSSEMIDSASSFFFFWSSRIFSSTVPRATMR